MSEETKRIISRKYICKGCFMPCVIEVGMDGYIPKCCILDMPANYSRYVPWEPLVEEEENEIRN